MPGQDATSSLATKPTLSNRPWPVSVAPATESVCLVPNEDGENCGVYFLPVSGEVILASICVYIAPPASTGHVENLPGVSKGPNTTCTSSISNLWSGTTTEEPRTSCHAKKTTLFTMGAIKDQAIQPGLSSKASLLSRAVPWCECVRYIVKMVSTVEIYIRWLYFSDPRRL